MNGMRVLHDVIYLLVFMLLVHACSDRLPTEIEESYHNLPDVVSFNFDIKPILSDRCFQCHGPDEKARKAELRLDFPQQMDAILADESSTIIVPGKPMSSGLVHRILVKDPEIKMPPPESNLALTTREQALLIKWIDQGAKWEPHWSFVAPKKSSLPVVVDQKWAQNEIDYFVLHKLEGHRLHPSERADRHTLIRRLSFDLTGLPPTDEEVDQFVSDPSKDTYERLVDRLLASPQFGERWTWEWLDVARYSDTNGFQGDPTRSMWPWRDWVIKAFNDNMPYDDFIVKQLAGDLLPNASLEDTLATAFNRNHTYNGEGGRIAEETRVENVFDRTETYGTAFLGLTFNCARCHDHKYDPLSQREYYQLFDFFNQTSEKGRGYNGHIPPVLDLNTTQTKRELADLRSFIQTLGNQLVELESQKFPRPEGEPASSSANAKGLPNFNDALGRLPKSRNTDHLELLYTYFKTKDHTYANHIKSLRDLKIKVQEKSIDNIQVMVMDQLDTPRQTYILERGGYDKLGEKVSMNVPDWLPPLPSSQRDRLALAQWTVSKEQPLTARVVVNRYWQSFFGHGIVKTIEDFGVQGALPSHPALLDWLAVDFQEGGWDFKALVKKIVLSNTYQQTSKVSPQLLHIDPENRLLARATRQRIPSWMIRDQALVKSGLLVDSIGGASVNPYQPEGIWEEATFGKIKYQQDQGEQLYRRTLYTFWRRISAPTVLFDNASRQVCTVQSIHTNTPLHALITLNETGYNEAARVMAQKILTKGTNDLDRLTYAFKHVTSRTPTSVELDILANRLKRLKDTYDQDPLAATLIAEVGEYPSVSKFADRELAAYAVISSILLNLDETINRQ